jgi:hypothetical protein
MKMHKFAILDKAKPDVENSLNLAAVRHKTVQVSELLL